MKKIYAFSTSVIIIGMLLASCSSKPVEITMPADMLSFASGAGIDITAEQETANDDGTITYILTKANHSKLLKDVADSIDALTTSIFSAEKSDEIFETIEFSDDYTALTVKMHDIAVNEYSMIAIYPAMLTAAMYQQFSGVEDSSIKMTLIDAATNEVVIEKTFP